MVVFGASWSTVLPEFSSFRGSPRARSRVRRGGAQGPRLLALRSPLRSPFFQCQSFPIFPPPGCWWPRTVVGVCRQGGARRQRRQPLRQHLSVRRGWRRSIAATARAGWWCSASRNQFGEQEAGSEQEIAAFCTVKIAVDFPMFGKIEVNGRAPTALPMAEARDARLEQPRHRVELRKIPRRSRRPAGEALRRQGRARRHTGRYRASAALGRRDRPAEHREDAGHEAVLAAHRGE